MLRYPSIFVIIASATKVFTGCGTCRYPRKSYLYLADVDGTHGPLITARNHPTSDSKVPGGWVGLFQDATGTVLGLPLTVASTGAVLACAPLLLHDEKITDTSARVEHHWFYTLAGTQGPHFANREAYSIAETYRRLTRR